MTGTMLLAVTVLMVGVTAAVTRFLAEARFQDRLVAATPALARDEADYVRSAVLRHEFWHMYRMCAAAVVTAGVLVAFGKVAGTG